MESHNGNDGAAFRKRWRDKRSRVYKAALLITVLAAFFGALYAVHDYPKTNAHIAMAWHNAPLAPGFDSRPAWWTPVFYFFNEAGSGIKYTVTGDEKYLQHFPTEELRRLRRAGYKADT
jgi:hypothetical protein